MQNYAQHCYEYNCSFIIELLSKAWPGMFHIECILNGSVQGVSVCSPWSPFTINRHTVWSSLPVGRWVVLVVLHPLDCVFREAQRQSIPQNMSGWQGVRQVCLLSRIVRLAKKRRRRQMCDMGFSSSGLLLVLLRSLPVLPKCSSSAAGGGATM